MTKVRSSSGVNYDLGSNVDGYTIESRTPHIKSASARVFRALESAAAGTGGAAGAAQEGGTAEEERLHPVSAHVVTPAHTRPSVNEAGLAPEGAIIVEPNEGTSEQMAGEAMPTLPDGEDHICPQEDTGVVDAARMLSLEGLVQDGDGELVAGDASVEGQDEEGKETAGEGYLMGGWKEEDGLQDEDESENVNKAVALIMPVEEECALVVQCAMRAWQVPSRPLSVCSLSLSITCRRARTSMQRHTHTHTHTHTHKHARTHACTCTHNFATGNPGQCRPEQPGSEFLSYVTATS